MLNRPDASQLTRVIQLNTINALTSNASALRLPVDWLIRDAMSPFGLVGPPPPSPVTTEEPGGTGSSAPLPPLSASLVPTAHPAPHPWIDLLPLARMRDNWLLAIYVCESLAEDDEAQLWDDLVEWAGGSGGDGAAAGLVVWGEPSDPRGWEVTVPFLRRWGGLLLQDCDEILEATNYWRSSRGERRLCFQGMS